MDRNILENKIDEKLISMLAEYYEKEGVLVSHTVQIPADECLNWNRIVTEIADLLERIGRKTAGPALKKEESISSDLKKNNNVVPLVMKFADRWQWVKLHLSDEDDEVKKIDELLEDYTLFADWSYEFQNQKEILTYPDFFDKKMKELFPKYDYDKMASIH